MFNEKTKKKNFLTKKEVMMKKTIQKKVSIKENECIWSKLGVISYRLCDNPVPYDCNNCEFNQMILDANESGEGSTVEGVDIIEKLKNLPAGERKCRYMLSGDVSFRLCTNNYHCGTCEFDQIMQDSIDMNPAVIRMRKNVKTKIKGFIFDSGLYYHEGHIWAKRFGKNSLKVGIDDFARRILGKEIKVHLPSEGTVLKRKALACEIEKGERKIYLFSPVNGIVEKINTEIGENPSIVHKNPYKKGWLFTVKPLDIEDSLQKFYYGSKARRWFTAESQKLFDTIKDNSGVLVQDGGEPIEDLFDSMPLDEWKSIVKEFLSM